MKLQKNTADKFPAGTNVFCTNPKTTREIKDIRAHFKKLGTEAIKALLPGAVVWIDLSPYNYANSRQGFTKCVLERIEKVESGIYLFFGKHSIAHIDTAMRGICRVADEAELYRLVQIYFKRTHVPQYA